MHDEVLYEVRGYEFRVMGFSPLFSDLCLLLKTYFQIKPDKGQRRSYDSDRFN